MSSEPQWIHPFRLMRPTGVPRRIVSDEAETTGAMALTELSTLAWPAPTPGRFQLYIDGRLVGDHDAPQDPGSPVTDENDGQTNTDPEAELKLHMARQ